MSLLRAVLAFRAAGINLTGAQIADAIWLAFVLKADAQRLEGSSYGTQSIQIRGAESADSVGVPLDSELVPKPRKKRLGEKADVKRVQDERASPPPQPSRETDFRITADNGPPLGKRRTIVRSDYPAIGAPDIARALRPLRVPVPLAGRVSLDIKRMVQDGARSGVLLPSPRSERGRYWCLVVVGDYQRIATLWRLEIKSLLRGLHLSGAFRRMRHWRIAAQGDDVHWSPRPSGEWREGLPKLAELTPDELMLVISDGLGDLWRSADTERGSGTGTARGVEWIKGDDRRVASRPSVHRRRARVRLSLVHLLPQRLWERTAFFGQPVRVQGKGLPGPGRNLGPTSSQRPMPVMSLSPGAISVWAKLWAGPPGAIGLAIPIEKLGLPPQRAWSGDDFIASLVALSPAARDLARALAISPLQNFSLDIIRVIRRSLAPHAGQADLAEVVHSVLERRKDGTPSSDTFVFPTGAQDQLARHVTRSEIESAIRTVGEHLHASGDLRAGLPVLMHAVSSGEPKLTPIEEEFARLSLDRLRALGGRYREWADSIGNGAEPISGPGTKNPDNGAQVGPRTPDEKRQENKDITFEEKAALADLLLRLPAFQSTQSLADLVSMLPRDIRERFAPGQDLRSSALKLLDVCASVTNGLDDLEKRLAWLTAGHRNLPACSQGLLGFQARLDSGTPWVPPSRRPPAPPLTPPGPTPPGPTIDFDEERRRFVNIVTGDDQHTRLITIAGNRGLGKTRLLEDYGQVAKRFGVDVVTVPLEAALSPHNCLDQIAAVCSSSIRVEDFRRTQRKGIGKQESDSAKVEWYLALTRAFLRDFRGEDPSPEDGPRFDRVRLVVLFDGFQQASDDIDNWIRQAFLGELGSWGPILTVIAGQPVPHRRLPQPPWPTRCHQHIELRGLSFDHAWRHIEGYGLSVTRSQLERLFVERVGSPKAMIPPLVLANFFGALHP